MQFMQQSQKMNLDSNLQNNIHLTQMSSNLFTTDKGKGTHTHHIPPQTQMYQQDTYYDPNLIMNNGMVNNVNG
jgi:hypothetical protein